MPTKRKIPVDQLRTGMYVAELDRPWLDTPFLMQGFQIEDAEDVRVVSQYCEYVWVDDAYVKPVSDISSDVGSYDFSAAAPVEYEVPMEVEHQRVKEKFKLAREFTGKMLGNIRQRKDFDAQAVNDTVGECVNSVLRNPDALLWMAKIRQESEYTAEHSLNVCILAVAFGRHLGFSQSDLEKLGLCGLLHDIGKMRVPIEILEKPDILSRKEMNMMKAHTVHGRNLLLSSPSVDPIVIDAAYSHHERVDGKGYPRKIPSNQTSVFARIISIVDAYDAMTANRCYSRAISTSDALKNIYQARGTQFDEELALLFIKTIGLFPVGSLVELYTGEIGIVIETNPQRRHLPRVAIVLDRDKRKKDLYKLVDLSHVEEGDLSQDFLIKQVLPDGTHGVFLQHYQQEGLLLRF